MTEELFWKLIEGAFSSNSGSFQEQIKLLEESLSEFSGEEIKVYERIFREVLMKSNHYNVMAACKIVEGYVSDDSFLYFRCGLIALGRDIYNSSISNPDILIGKLKQDVEGELLLYVADNAFISKFGESDMELPRDHALDFIDYDDLFQQISGDDWVEQDLPIRCPLLTKEYSK